MSEIPFDEVRVPLFSHGWKEAIEQYSPAGRVPVLLDEGYPVWDSLAIIEYICERHSSAVGWPDNPVERARARSIVAEMHSGFAAIREELPQNIRARKPCELTDLSENCRAEIHRITEIWSKCRSKYECNGHWLFGPLSIADIMFAPVALRFVTYDIAVESPADEFVREIQGLEPIREWEELSRAETEELAQIDSLRA